MADQLLQGAEGDSRGDVESSVVQGPNLIMFNCVPSLRVQVPDGQGVAACGGRRGTKQLFYSVVDFCLHLHLLRIICGWVMLATGPGEKHEHLQILLEGLKAFLGQRRCIILQILGLHMEA